MLKIFIHNTLTGTREEFVPRDEGTVSMYVCGPTVYNYIHIGNARVYVFFDVVKRFLQYAGYTVRYVSNFTDIDDKILKRAAEEGRDWRELARQYEQAFLEDVEALGLEPADVRPRATEHIPEMLDIISRLVEAGYAYEAGGDVFFSVEAFAGYGKLSKRSLEDMRAGERVEVNPLKRNPLDFVLWKASKPGEPAWESPWGPGRPGWHIECSAMSTKYLGFGFDIHGGGQDLIFPHHENEIAQAEAAFGASPFVRYWMHNGLLTIRSEKMAKSVGNIILLRDALAQYGPDVLKMFYLSTHYRSALDYAPERLDEARASLERIYECVSYVRFLLRRSDAWQANADDEGASLRTAAARARDDFTAALADDFNTARALAAVFDFVRDINLAAGNLATMPPAAVLSDALDVLGELLGVLGIDVDRFEAFALSRLTNLRSGLLALASRYGVNGADEHELIENLLAQRAALRSRKEFEAADAIRHGLEELGIEVKDTKLGSRWLVMWR
jgi:cysteinyl-tRNA synthetase